jgi:hypothetical protein
MIEPQPSADSEPEGYNFRVYLQGAGAANPTRLNTRNNYTPTRTGVGTLKITFQDEPGPTFQGLGGFGFGDPTPANVAGWTVVAIGYTARTASAQAFVTVQVYNGANAAAELPATSQLSMQLKFKQAAAVE